MTQQDELRSPATAIRILREYLVANGYDGLYSPHECACKCDDLVPCSSDFSRCRPGYLQACDCGDHSWHIGAQRQVPAQPDSREI